MSVKNVSNRSQLAEFIKSDLPANYTIALHNIAKRKHELSQEEIAKEIIKTKLKSIYYTYRRTAFEKGFVKYINALSFDYQIKDSTPHNKQEKVYTDDLYYNIILAIPQKLYSDSGVMVPLYPDKAHSKTIGGHDMCSVFDFVYCNSKHKVENGNVVKDTERGIPNEFVYGYYIANPTTGETKLVTNKNHIAKLATSDRQSYNKFVEGSAKLFEQKIFGNMLEQKALTNDNDVQEIIKDLKNTKDAEKCSFLDIKQEYLQNKLKTTMQKDFNQYLSPAKPKNDNQYIIAKPKKLL